jgi:hypothetical protein
LQRRPRRSAGDVDWARHALVVGGIVVAFLVVIMATATNTR